MVHLTKIYTKTGDDGTTSLANYSRTHKHGIEMEAIGAVDEANSAIGMIKGYNLDQIQNDLFDAGAVLAGSDTVRITEDRINMLEGNIDSLNEALPPLHSFVLPKGEIHNARAIVRRAERRVWAATLNTDIEDAYKQVARYLNRLSDYLFVLARYDSGRLGEVLWKPMGQNEK